MSSMVVARAAAFLAPALSIVLACNGGGGGAGVGTETDSDSSGDTGSSATVGTTATSTTVGTTFGTTMTTTTATSDTDGGEGPCCGARGEAGCSEEPAIAECVCETDRYCCETTWDDVCGDKVEALGCGVCQPGGTTVSTTSPSTTMTTADVTTGEPPMNVGPCCAAHPETGCEIAGLSECVCTFEPQCCTEEWSELCVDAVDDYGCGVCPPDPGTTTTTATSDTDTGPPPDNTEGCCITHDSTGCEYPSIAECVCAANPECCIEGWSDACIDAVGDLGCGICPP